MSAMRRGASSRSVTRGIGFAVKATKSRTWSRRLSPAACTGEEPGDLIEAKVFRCSAHRRPAREGARGHARMHLGRRAGRARGNFGVARLPGAPEESRSNVAHLSVARVGHG